MQDCIETAALKMPEDTGEKIRDLVDNLESVNTNDIIAAMQAV